LALYFGFKSPQILERKGKDSVAFSNPLFRAYAAAAAGLLEKDASLVGGCVAQG